MNCWNCVYRDGKCKNDEHMEDICRSSNMRYWKYDINKPVHSFSLCKQLIFDCAMDLTYCDNDNAKDAISKRLIEIVQDLDKMKVVE